MQPMFRKISLLAFSSMVLVSCTTEGEICDCWKELVTKESDKPMSDGCEYILTMSREEITAEAGPSCVDEINKILFDDDDIEFNEEIDENALFEQGDY